MVATLSGAEITVELSRDEKRALLAAITRRRIVLAGAAAALAGQAPVFAEDATPWATPGTTGWSFTDDAGNTITLPDRPLRIVADLNAAAALWDYGIRPVGVSGWAVGTDESWGNLDRSTPDITAGAGTGAPDAEKYLALKPDLFVTILWGNETSPYQWSFMDQETYDRLKEIAPIIGISSAGSADQNAARVAELAAALGANLDAPDQVAAQSAYDDTVAEFKRIAAEKAGLDVLFGRSEGGEIVLANPPVWADLAMYQAFGLNIVTPEGAAREDWWVAVSPEQIANFPADVLFLSSRAGASSPEELAADPVLQFHPAVAAGQVGAWNQNFIQSHVGLTDAMNRMLAVMREAEDVTP